MGRNRFGMLAAGAAACLLLLASAAESQAQFRRGRGYAKAEVERAVRRLDNASDRFVRSFDNALDRSRMDNTVREDRLNERAAELDREIDVLRQEFDRTDRYQDTREQVSRVISAAQRINTVVARRRLAPNAERQWAAVRREVNSLASYYNLRGLR